jgi:hypothetical protein
MRLPHRYQSRQDKGCISAKLVTDMFRFCELWLPVAERRTDVTLYSSLLASMTAFACHTEVIRVRRKLAMLDQTTQNAASVIMLIWGAFLISLTGLCHAQDLPNPWQTSDEPFIGPTPVPVMEQIFWVQLPIDPATQIQVQVPDGVSVLDRTPARPAPLHTHLHAGR